MDLLKNVGEFLKTVQNFKFLFPQAVHIGSGFLVLRFETSNGLSMLAFGPFHRIVGFLHLYTAVNGTSDSNSTGDGGSSA